MDPQTNPIHVYGPFIVQRFSSSALVLPLPHKQRMSGQDTRSRTGTDADIDHPPEGSEAAGKAPSDIEKTPCTEVHMQPAIGGPIPAQPIDPGLDDDELFPEGGRGWLVVLGCFMLSA
jgi:hypothetical protein